MESSFSYAFSDLWADTSEYRGKGRSPTGDDLTTAKRRVNDSYRKFLALDWEFLSKIAVLRVDAGKYIYELPDDFGVLRIPFIIFPNSGYANPVELPLGNLWKNKSFFTMQGTPLYFSLQSEFSEGKGLRKVVHFYPTPSTSYEYNYMYKVFPNELVNDADIPYCPANLSHVLREFCLAEVELYDEEGAKTTHTNILLNALLPQAIKENSIRSPNTVGSMNLGGMFAYGLHPIWGNNWTVNGEFMNG